MQTQEYQQLADTLEQWISIIQASLNELEPIATKSVIVQFQMEHFQVTTVLPLKIDINSVHFELLSFSCYILGNIKRHCRKICNVRKR